MPDGVEALYPFLYEGEANDDTVSRDVARSVNAKVGEIVALRAQVAETLGPAIEACAAAMAARFAAGGRLLAFGNGGSATDAHGLTELFMAPPRGRALPAIALADDVPTLTALANDVGFDVVFARQIAARARPHDIAFALSTSGGSENVVQGLREAKQRGLLTVGVAGYDGGRMGDVGLVDHLLIVTSASVHRIQEAQATVLHLLWELTQR